jgi:hypothetical protein
VTKRSALLVFWLTFAVGYNYLFLVFGPAASKFLDLHQRIIDHTAPSPYAYRVLVPEFVRGVAHGLNLVLHNQHKANIGAYAAFDFAAIAVSLIAIYLLLRGEFPETTAIVGLVLAGLSMMIAFEENQPWSFLEPGMFAFGLLWFRQGRYWLILPLIALATLNRETSIFLVLILGLAAYRSANQQRKLLWVGACLVIWAGVYGAVRALIGTHPHEYSIRVYAWANFRPLSLVLTPLRDFLFLGPFWLVAWRGWRIAPTWLRQAAFAFPVFLVVAAPWSLWWEVRLWTPFYCIFLPLVLYGLGDLLERMLPQSEPETSPGSSLPISEHVATARHMEAI